MSLPFPPNTIPPVRPAHVAMAARKEYWSGHIKHLASHYNDDDKPVTPHDITAIRQDAENAARQMCKGTFSFIKGELRRRPSKRYRLVLFTGTPNARLGIFAAELATALRKHLSRQPEWSDISVKKGPPLRSNAGGKGLTLLFRW